MSAKTAKYVPPQDLEELTLAWLRRARESQLCHYKQADTLASRGRCLGMPVIILSTVVGTSVFASTAEQLVPLWSKIILGLLSVTAAVLSSLQTFFNYPDRAEKHRTAAAKFGATRRKFEEMYARRTERIDRQLFDSLRAELDALARESPNVPPSIYQKIQSEDVYIAPQILSTAPTQKKIASDPK